MIVIGMGFVRVICMLRPAEKAEPAMHDAVNQDIGDEQDRRDFHDRGRAALDRRAGRVAAAGIVAVDFQTVPVQNPAQGQNRAGKGDDRNFPFMDGFVKLDQKGRHRHHAKPGKKAQRRENGRQDATEDVARLRQDQGPEQAFLNALHGNLLPCRTGGCKAPSPHKITARWAQARRTGRRAAGARETPAPCHPRQP